jgi:hypothetical protein
MVQFFLEGPRSRSYGRTAALRLFVQPCDEDDQFSFSFFHVMEHRWNEIDRKKPKYSGKTCPRVTLSTTNATWTDPGLNPGIHSARPATNRLSHGTAQMVHLLLRQHLETMTTTTKNLSQDSPCPRPDLEAAYRTRSSSTTDSITPFFEVACTPNIRTVTKAQ